MLRIVLLISLVMPSTQAEDFHLSDKQLQELLKKVPDLRREQRSERTLVCAIPLKEARGMPGKDFDPMVRPSTPMNFDRIARATPIPACPVERAAGRGK